MFYYKQMNFNVGGGGGVDYTGFDIVLSLHDITNSGGNCLRLRRSSDNAESDFGFSGGVLDTASIDTWLGGSTGYVVKWYNKGTHGGDWSESTTAAQPIIDTSNVRINSSGQGRLSDDAGTIFKFNSSTGNCSFSTFRTPATTTRNGTLYTEQYYSRAYNTSGGTFFCGHYVVATSLGTLSTSTDYLLTDIRSSSSMDYYIDGTFNNNQTPALSSPGASQPLTLLNIPGSTGFYWDGQIYEFLATNSDISSDRSSYETDIKTRYSI